MDDSEAIGVEVRRLLADSGRSQPWLGAEVAHREGRADPYSQAVVSGWLNGQGLNPRRVKVESTIPTVAELHRLIAAADELDPDLAVLLRVGAALGGRRAELVGLRWRDIEGATVRVHRTVVSVKGAAVEKDTKSHAERSVPLDAETMAALARHRADCDERARLQTREGVLRPDAFVFSREPDGSKPLNPDGVTKAFGRFCRACGFVEDDGSPRFHLHQLRHLNASLQLAAGVPVHRVQKRLGHAQASTTMNIYGRAMPENDDGAAGVLGRLLGPMSGAPPAQEPPPPAPELPEG